MFNKYKMDLQVKAPNNFSDSYTLNEVIALFYQKNGFGPIAGDREPLTVGVYTGCLIVPMPNIGVRHKYLKYHDMHHILTGYTVGRIGEGEVSAWELGTGSMFRHPILGVMNLIALSTGFFLKPKRIVHAYGRGLMSSNTYDLKTRQWIDANGDAPFSQLKQKKLENKKSVFMPWLRWGEFAFYLSAAMLIHAIVVIPALILRIISYLLAGEPFIEIIKPAKRSDLY
ncbi:hypothetical protein EXE25_13150 [Acinetobacter bouvetii]|uniref:Uncharacterized protein n=2 Tax=Moraxellaceae TaxID=468 RepID=A0A4V2DP57_9GAMM|nr:hypothetical protein EXE25_13150 [Acinetobacter bouvetii]TCB77072.1 hypothetical protein E0H91_02090 [Acinetobacter sp. ANC 4177]